MPFKLFPVLAVFLLLATQAVAQDSEDSVVPDAEPKKSRLEGFNRGVHKFNNKLDDWVLRPVTKGYKAITPDPVENGISNFFSNLGEIVNIPNDLLQGKFKQAGNDTGRLLINSTLGLLGFFDLAQEFGLEKSDGEDIGQTLAKWGVPSGPYLVLPFLGPSTLRDFPSDIVQNMTIEPIPQVDDVRLRNTLYAMELIDTRAGLLDLDKMVTGDDYTFIKQAYLQRREFLINDGEVEDDFGDFDESDEYGDYEE